MLSTARPQHPPPPVPPRSLAEFVRPDPEHRVVVRRVWATPIGVGPDGGIHDWRAACTSQSG